MTGEWIGEAAKLFGVGAAVLLVLAASAYTAVKVLRSDRTLAGIIERLESERDYYREQLARERTDAAAMEERLNTKLDQQAAEASSERAELIGEIQKLREAVQKKILHPPPLGA